MLKLDTPLQLSPIVKPKIWGCDDLSPIFTRLPSPTSSTHSIRQPELIGEVWITDDESRFMNGPIAGMKLAEASEKLGPQIHGSAWTDHRFPILAKYIYTSDWLSVQVHPDDEEASRFDPGHRGKCEMWYFVSSDRRGELLLSAKPGATKETLRRAFEKGLSRRHLQRFHPKAREAIFIPPGTVHALGPGLVLFEVEENSDLTYRLDDFGRMGLGGRPRPLHLDKGIAVTRPDSPPLRDLPIIRVTEPYGSRRLVVACRFFALEELTLRKRGRFQASPDRVEVFSILEGRGRVETAAGWLGYHTGDTWLIPPASSQYRLVPGAKTRLLKFFVPDIEKDFRRPLLKRGVQPAKIAKIVFD